MGAPEGPAESPQEGGAPLPDKLRSLGYPRRRKTGGTVRPASRVPFPHRLCTKKVRRSRRRREGGVR